MSEVDKWDAGRFNRSSQTPQRALVTDSKLGRKPTSIQNAIEEMYFLGNDYDPLKFIRDNNEYFVGLTHFSPLPAYKKEEPVYLGADEITHSLYVHSTGGGKGIYEGIKIAEAGIKKNSCIVIDPKGDEYLPAIAKKYYGHNFIMIDWPRDFKLDLFNYGDFSTLSDRIAAMLSLEDVDDPRVSYYRRIGRTTLRKTLDLFKSRNIWPDANMDFAHFNTFLRCLSLDLLSSRKYKDEMDKAKINVEIIERHAQRYFDPKVVESLYIEADMLRAIGDLDLGLSEITYGANWTQDFNLEHILYSETPTCLYIRFPAISISGRKVIKLLLGELIQRVLKRPAARDVLVCADEVSLYANEGLSTSLSLVRSGRLNFLLLLQDIAQLPLQYRNPIMSNCNVKLFGKQSTKEDIEYLRLIGGIEPITAYGMNVRADTLRQENEEYLNVTRQRALPMSKTMTLIAEAFPTSLHVYSSPVPVSAKWDYSHIDNLDVKTDGVMLNKKFNLQNTERENLEDSKGELSL